jgi:uncharacterized protein DUF6325
MAIGPVEYMIVGFPGNRFRGEIAPELAKLVNSGTIRILDLVFILKDADGSVATFEFDQLDELGAFADVDGEVGGLISKEDIEHAAALLEPNYSEALLVWEDVWATPFVDALRRADGVVLEGARIPRELIETAFSDLASAER